MTPMETVGLKFHDAIIHTMYEGVIEEAILKEREACAMTAENTSVYDRYSPEDTIAGAIRARGQA